LTLFAYCGLNCSECPALRATVSGNPETRKQIAEEWSEIYSADIDPEDINCMGCSTKDERKFSHCFNCSIRQCAMEKSLSSCHECSDYPCVDLQEFFELVPEAEINLERLRDPERH